MKIVFFNTKITNIIPINDADTSVKKGPVMKRMGRIENKKAGIS